MDRLPDDFAVELPEIAAGWDAAVEALQERAERRSAPAQAAGPRFAGRGMGG